jgi:hypothetical protein
MVSFNLVFPFLIAAQESGNGSVSVHPPLFGDTPCRYAIRPIVHDFIPSSIWKFLMPGNVQAFYSGSVK